APSAIPQPPGCPAGTRAPPTHQPADRAAFGNFLAGLRLQRVRAPPRTGTGGSPATSGTHPECRCRCASNSPAATQQPGEKGEHDAATKNDRGTRRAAGHVRRGGDGRPGPGRPGAQMVDRATHALHPRRVVLRVPVLVTPVVNGEYTKILKA